MSEFSEHGFGGARTDRIAANAQVNKQALYYHFGNKNDLFTAVLDDAYRRFYEGYAHVGPTGLPPEEQFRALLNNIFDVHVASRKILPIFLEENRMQGHHLPNTRARDFAGELIRTIEGILDAGKEQGRFRPELQAQHLWISILALCVFNFTHAYTLTNILDWDISKPQKLAERKAHIIHLVMAAIAQPDAAAAAL